MVGFTPTKGAQTPLVTGLKTWKPVTGIRRGQVIAFAFGIFEKPVGHGGADHVFAAVVGPGVAMAVAIKAGERINRTDCQILAEHIFLSGGTRGAGLLLRCVSRQR